LNPAAPVPWAGAPWTPRAWQAAALPAIQASLRNNKRGLVWAVTGAGKSRLIAELCYLAAARSTGAETVVISTPSEDLVQQLSDTIAARCGTKRVGVFYGKRKNPKRPIVVTCNPSLLALAVELAALGRKARLLIADECHKTEADTLKDAIPQLAPRWVCGFTATAYRSDDAQALSMFDEIAFRYSLEDALRDRVLVPWRIERWHDPDSIEINGVCLEMIRRHGLALGPGVVSAKSIADAEEHADYLRQNGVAAAAIHSRMNHAARQALLDGLRAGPAGGGFDCLVHVSLLAEGIDLPWLRWLCLRRKVDARVRFVQEIGRVLRVDPANPAKTYGLLMDPHDLFGRHGLAHDAAIGTAIDTGGMDQDEQPKKRRGPAKPAPLPPATAVDVVTGWTRDLVLAMQAAGIAGPDRIEDAIERSMSCSRSQQALLVGNPDATDGKGRGLVYYARFLPEPARQAVKDLCHPDVVPGLQRGCASDLITILEGLRKATAKSRQSWATGGAVGGPPAPWRWPDAIEVRAVDAGAVAGIRALAAAAQTPAGGWFKQDVGAAK
jgi:hypothetical protein